MSKQFAFDNAQICKAGHVANIYKGLHPEYNTEHCLICSEEIISECPSCHTPIRGGYYSREVFSTTYAGSIISQQHSHTRTHTQELTTLDNYQIPAYCHKCGNPYPWTAERLAVGEQIVDALEGLDPDQKSQLKSLFPDLIIETPRSHLAVIELAKIVEAFRSFGKDVFINWLFNNIAPTLYTLLKTLLQL